MIQAYNPFARMMTAGFYSWKLSIQITETMIASQAVIGTRMSMLGKGLDGTGKIPFAEFSQLIPEKTAAFGKANAGALHAMGKRGAMPPSLSGALMSDNLWMFDWWERSLSATGAWWLPVHAQATANAKRLSRARLRERSTCG